MQNLYDEAYYQNYRVDNGTISYRESQELKALMDHIAAQIKERYNPQTVLDAGCAMGLLVASLRDVGIAAYGIDISEYAVSQVRADIRPYCVVGSLTDPLPESLPGQYDLVVSMEVLEHLTEEDGKRAIANLCAVTDRFLFCSSPDDTEEPTHINLHEPPYWCGLFAAQGMFTAGEEQPAFLTPYALSFHRQTVEKAAEAYEVQREAKLAENGEKLEELEICKAELEEYRQLYFKKVKEYDFILQAYQATIASTAWRITKPLRAFRSFLKSHKATMLIGKAVKGVLRDGPAYTWKRVKRRIAQDKKGKEFGKFDAKELVAQRKAVFPRQVKFSILVPLYNTPENFLKEMIASVQAQTYPDWELCLADGSDNEHAQVGQIVARLQQSDARIKYQKLEKNLGISGNTNACIQMATGNYIALFDHDDLLHPSVLYEDMRAICEQGADFIYTDEVIFQGTLKNIVNTHFKPDFAIDNLRANNYICHFTVFQKELLDKVGLFRSECDGSQDFDMVLRLTEQAQKIVHIPKALYFWRSHPQSVASDISAKPYVIEAAKKAVRDHLQRVGLQGEVTDSKALSIYRIQYEIEGEPLVSILIPNKDHVDELKKCILSIRSKTTYSNYEIIVIENNSSEPRTFDYYKTIEKNSKIRVVTWDGPFNYSAINNFGIQFANGSYFLLLNNDTEVISADWIQEMLMYAQRSDVGAVGAKLYYPNETIQHGGVLLGLGGCAGHLGCDQPRDDYGYMGRLIYASNVSAVTAACMMVRKDVWEQANGLDESFEVAFNDVDFCLRLRKLGYLIVFTPFAELYHYESKSRKRDDTPEKRARFVGEVGRFQTRWAKELEAGDPYYNPNFSMDNPNFSVKWR
ncbi:MAG: glycosyltransferase [Oscillospiraceae bacterium]|nr:glycosyltransferase [Oscillospiraceae bacterium]